SGRSNSASTMTAVSATGPPTKTGSVSPVSHDRSGTASPTVEPAGRLSTSPIAPSSVCSAIRTTVRAKFGSRRTGEARMSLPRSDSAIPALCLPAHGLPRLLRLLLAGLGLLLARAAGHDRGLRAPALARGGGGAIDAHRLPPPQAGRSRRGAR